MLKDQRLGGGFHGLDQGTVGFDVGLVQAVECVIDRLRMMAVKQPLDALRKLTVPVGVFDPTARVGQTQRGRHQPLGICRQM